MDMEILLLAAGIGGAMLLLALALAGGGRQRAWARRVHAVNLRAKGVAAPVRAGSVKREERHRLPGLEKLLGPLLPKPEAFRRRLRRTGRNIDPGVYALVCVLLAVAAALGLRYAGGLMWPLSLAGGAAVGVWSPHLWVGRLGRRRVERFVAGFPDAIDLMVRGLRSGLPVTESIAAVGREMAGPIGEEFRQVSDAVRLGSTLDDALWAASARLDCQEFKYFIISLAIQKETGGNLGETLANLSDILRRRRQMRLKVAAMSSEARASALILGSLPVAMFAIIYLLNPEYEGQLLSDPRGRAMLGGVAALMTFGVLVMRKMVRFEI